jgi:hypothetical protein
MDAEHIADLTFCDSTLDDLVDWVIPVIECDLCISRHQALSYPEIDPVLTVMCLPNCLQAWLMARHFSTAVVIGFSVITRTSELP